MHLPKIPNALTTKALALPLQDNSNKLTKYYCTLCVLQNPTIPAEESCFIAICTQVKRAKYQGFKSHEKSQHWQCSATCNLVKTSLCLILLKWPLKIKGHLSKIQAWRSTRKLGIFRFATSKSIFLDQLCMFTDKTTSTKSKSPKQSKKNSGGLTLIE